MRLLISRLAVILVLLSIFGISMEFGPREAMAVDGSVSGKVSDTEGLVSGALVRVRATENFTMTDGSGSFMLSGLTPGVEVEITAWSKGYYVAGVKVIPPATGIDLALRRYHEDDYSEYTWISPTPDSSDKACGNCHPMILPQWEINAHGKAITNTRFFSMYNGTDTTGIKQIGPGYLDDFPGTAGNCANCHAPAAAVDGYLMTNMNEVRGVLSAGIHCDYCHKVGGVFLNPADENVYPNAPGVSSQKILRPPAVDQIFFGPYDDIPDPDTYLPEISESRFCAPCHQFSFWGTPIYESYTEWLESPYPAAGITCQKCHMPPTGDTHYALPEVGGLPHPPNSIPSHLQLGAENTELLQNAVELSTVMSQVGNRIAITVQITNNKTGHHVPTDHPGRHLILILHVVDQQGKSLAQLSGSKVPAWGGDQTGEPGKAYAKVLRDVASSQYPVVSYWKRTNLVSDNRIPAGESDISRYIFLAPPTGETVNVTVELRFRRLFQEDMLAKDWQTPDVIMEQITQTEVVDPWWVYYLPLTTTR